MSWRKLQLAAANFSSPLDRPGGLSYLKRTKPKSLELKRVVRGATTR